MTTPSSTPKGPDLGSIEIDTTVAHQGRVYDYLAVRHEAPFDRAG